MERPPGPLILLHGFGSSFDHNWRKTGWVDILADFDVSVPAIDLPGHGSSPPLTDPAAYADLDEQVRRTLPADEHIVGVGFSAGAELLLRLAVADRSVSTGSSSSGWGTTFSSRATPLDRGGTREQRRAGGRSDPAVPPLGPVGGQRPESSLGVHPSTPPTGHRGRALGLHCPILVVLGDRDMVDPPTG